VAAETHSSRRYTFFNPGPDPRRRAGLGLQRLGWCSRLRARRGAHRGASRGGEARRSDRTSAGPPTAPRGHDGFRQANPGSMSLHARGNRQSNGSATTKLSWWRPRGLGWCIVFLIKHYLLLFRPSVEWCPLGGDLGLGRPVSPLPSCRPRGCLQQYCVAVQCMRYVCFSAQLQLQRGCSRKIGYGCHT
jgi:hypothetical protein